MADKTWYVKTRVVICGVRAGRVVSGGGGAQHFKTLAAALKIFPDLDPHQATSRFTSAKGDPEKGEMRFETHQAHELYSY